MYSLFEIYPKVYYNNQTLKELARRNITSWHLLLWNVNNIKDMY